MDKRKMIIIFGLLAAGGCKEEPQGRTTERVVNPENTAVNVRDRGGQLPTAGDQAENKADIDLAAAIRKAVMADDTLSATAKNVKIIVSNGAVTLRGPVESTAEKASIVAKAKDLAGNDRVDDKLDVTSKPAGTAEPQVPTQP